MAHGPGLTLATAALAASASACEREAPDQVAPSAGESALVGVEDEVHMVGQRAKARDYDMSVESVEDCKVSRPFRPKKGYKKLGVEVVITGTTDKEVPVNPFYASLRSESGETYESTLAGCTPGLEAVRVTEGKQARGWITFDMHDNATKLEMRYAPMVIGVGRERVRFDLGR